MTGDCQARICGGPVLRCPRLPDLSTVVAVAVAACDKSSASGCAGRSGDRPSASLRAGHRRGSPRRQDALATSGRSLECQLLVVPGNDPRIHSCSADSRKHWDPLHACQSLSDVIGP